METDRRGFMGVLASGAAALATGLGSVFGAASSGPAALGLANLPPPAQTPVGVSALALVTRLQKRIAHARLIADFALTHDLPEHVKYRIRNEAIRSLGGSLYEVPLTAPYIPRGAPAWLERKIRLEAEIAARRRLWVEDKQNWLGKLLCEQQINPPPENWAEYDEYDPDALI